VYQPVEAAMRLLLWLTGLRNGRRDARGYGGMLLVMLALSGWLAPRSKRRPARGR
jgi:hypothetical protein